MWFAGTQKVARERFIFPRYTASVAREPWQKRITLFSTTVNEVSLLQIRKKISRIECVKG